MITDKTIRAYQQWLKITRNSSKKTFTFARGYQNQLTAHQVKTYPFAMISIWDDAVQFANQTLRDYA